MKSSKVLLGILAVGFIVAMTTNVEGQMFRRSNNCCGQQMYSAPAIRYAQPQVMNYRPMTNRRVYRVYRVYRVPARPAMNNCGCNGNVVMGGGVSNGSSMMNGNVGGSVLNGGNENGSGLSVVTINESCQTINTNCLSQCATKFPNDPVNRELCEKHCACNLTKCNACGTNRIVTCSDPAAPGQSEQPDPCATSTGPGNQ